MIGMLIKSSLVVPTPSRRSFCGGLVKSLAVRFLWR